MSPTHGRVKGDEVGNLEQERLVGVNAPSREQVLSICVPESVLKCLGYDSQKGTDYLSAYSQGVSGPRDGDICRLITILCNP